MSGVSASGYSPDIHKLTAFLRVFLETKYIPVMIRSPNRRCYK
jgi:hypothetical protein